jgi:predicted nuclease of restriction endonuclease-like RecB superfamily
VLTADLASVRRRGDELRLVPLDEAGRARVEELAAAYRAIARACVGRPRDELEARFREIAAPARDRKLAAAVLKLVRDRCVFEEAAAEAAALRRQLFERATATRRALPPGAGFDRDALVAEAAREQGLPPEEIERRLFADRPGALRLQAVEAPEPAALAAGFDLAQAQAVLLRAVTVTARVQARDAGTYRRLFQRLKFLRLLPTIEREPEGGYRLQIDGPFSLFQAVTRYGLQLGLALPAIAECDRWSLEADLRWGSDRHPRRFRLAGSATADGDGAPALPPEVETFAAAFEALGSPWRIDRAPAVLDLPGAGLCVPDLAFERDGARVYLEVLGFWSREAVWRRVELMRAGLPYRILFAASRHLRVSEAILEDVPGAGLYVYARVMSPQAILKRLDELAPPG